MLLVAEQGGAPGVLHHAGWTPQLRFDVVHYERRHARPGAARHAAEPARAARAEAETHATVSELMAHSSACRWLYELRADLTAHSSHKHVSVQVWPHCDLANFVQLPEAGQVQFFLCGTLEQSNTRTHALLCGAV